MFTSIKSVAHQRFRYFTTSCPEDAHRSSLGQNFLLTEIYFFDMFIVYA